MTETKITNQMYAKVQSLFAFLNLRIKCEFGMGLNNSEWEFECYLKSPAFPTKLRAEVIQNSKKVFGTEASVVGQSPDEAFSKVFDLICIQQAEIDVFEVYNSDEVWGNYKQSIGVWKYNPTTGKMEKLQKQGKEYHDPEEYK